MDVELNVSSCSPAGNKMQTGPVRLEGRVLEVMTVRACCNWLQLSTPDSCCEGLAHSGYAWPMRIITAQSVGKEDEEAGGHAMRRKGSRRRKRKVGLRGI